MERKNSRVLDPLLAIAGERAMDRFVFESIPSFFIQGFMVETALNYFCIINKTPVKYAKLKDLDIIVKEKSGELLRVF